MSAEPEHDGPGAHERTGGPAGWGVRRVLAGFGRWRNTRPFWGGVLVILGGGVILLSEKAPVSVMVHLGLQGLAGYLIPAIMLLCGVLLLVNPAQRTFYALLATLLALGSFITSNLGGFFVGMLLGLIGGSLAFAWEQRDGPRRRDGAHRRRPHPPSWLGHRTGKAPRLSLVVNEPDDSGESAGPARDEPGGSGPASDAGRSRADDSASYRAPAGSAR